MLTQALSVIIQPAMEFRRHIGITGRALKGWLIAASYDALAVGLMWLVGLEMIRVPWAPVWALSGALLQFVPHFGPVLALIPPALVGLFSGGFDRFLYVLILYAVIAVCEGFDNSLTTTPFPGSYSTDIV